MNAISRQIEIFLMAWMFALAAAAANGQPGHRHGARVELGTSAAVDPQGRLWIARTEPAGTGAFVVLQMSADMGKTWSAPRRVQQAPEPVEANGEARPQLAFGDKGQVYVSYTRPLGKPHTGEIRFARSLDGGQTFSAPVTVHRNRDLITHRFNAMVVDKAGRLYIAWIDKRDAEAARARKRKYAGAATYFAVSEDGGARFKGDYKIADHTCECCRIALALDTNGKAVALWRHVFAPNVRDHALAVLAPDGTASAPIRSTFDDWRIDACPHQGPSLAYGPDGSRHQVWFHGKGDSGGLFYASAAPSAPLGTPVRLGSPQAAHGDVAVHGRRVAVVWKQFDGESTAVFGRLSQDGGSSWRDLTLARTAGNSDHPHLVQTATGLVLVWRTVDEGVQTIPLDLKN